MRTLILLSILYLSGCATVPGSGMQIDTVSQGQALPGASCNVSNAGQTSIVTTPAVVPMPNRYGELRVVCDKPGYRTSELILQDVPGSGGFGWPGSSLGVGISGGSGGRVGMGVGLSFPFFSGEAGMPRRVTIEMNPQQ